MTSVSASASASVSPSVQDHILVIDVRTLAPQQRHATIFGRFDDLLPGESLQLVNDHDPQPLHRQLLSRSPGQFQWTCLEEGPQQWRVQITKQEVAGGKSSCCGACGG